MPTVFLRWMIELTKDNSHSEVIFKTGDSSFAFYGLVAGW